MSSISSFCFSGRPLSCIRQMAALLTISKKLEKLDKSKAKGKGVKPLTATARTTPRESGAETDDNRPDPSNFGRDTFPGFDA